MKQSIQGQDLHHIKEKDSPLRILITTIAMDIVDMQVIILHFQGVPRTMSNSQEGVEEMECQ